MGALSSWAMLAVTHHLIVQAAYHKVHGYTYTGKFWYDNYEILGDDVIIFDKDVAEAYLALMAELGVPINLSKSVVAVNPTTEFAKVTTHYGVNVSAISWKMFISQNTFQGRVNILWSLLNKDYLPLSHLGTWLLDVTAKSVRNRGLENLVYLPLLTLFAYQGKINYEDILRGLFSKEEMTLPDNKKVLLKEHNATYLRNLVINLITGKDLRLMSKNPTWEKELAILKGAIVRSIKAPNLDPSRISVELAHYAISEMYPYLGNPKIWDPVLKVQFSEVLSAEVDLRNCMKEIFFDALSRAEVDIPFNYLKLEVRELLELRDKADRGSQILTLLNRTKEALITKKPKVTKVKPSLQVLKDILIMRKFVAR
jgi:hypothetical protein